MGLELSASTLRNQIGLSPDLGICEKRQVNRSLDRPVATAVYIYAPSLRARIAHGITGTQRSDWMTAASVGRQRPPRGILGSSHLNCVL